MAGPGTVLKTASAGHRYRGRGADPVTEAVSGISEEVGDLTWALVPDLGRPCAMNAASGRQARSRRPAFDVLLRLVHRIPGTPCQVLDCLGEEFAPAILFAPSQLAA